MIKVGDKVIEFYDGIESRELEITKVSDKRFYCKRISFFIDVMPDNSLRPFNQRFKHSYKLKVPVA